MTQSPQGPPEAAAGRDAPSRTTRRQLSLYVPPTAARELDALRRVLDPVQAGLIPLHVTLCREDELATLSEASLYERLSAPGVGPIVLEFGSPEAFFEHGILMSCVAGEGAFHELRRHVLGAAAVRTHRPHLTLAHPRNPKAPGNSLAYATSVTKGATFALPTVCLIEQHGADPWVLLRAFELTGVLASPAGVRADGRAR
jgi:2'-5' RNA ligase superfamily protein